MTDDVRLTVLARALDQAERVLGGVDPDQLRAATPCTDWDVQRLVDHLVADPGKLAMSSRGEEPDWSSDPRVELARAATSLRAGADELLAQWRQQGPDADTTMADWQTAEIAVHTWDLARATGQPVEALDVEVAERGAAFMAAGLTDDNRGEAFAPLVQVPDDAAPYDRLAAVAGRGLAV